MSDTFVEGLRQEARLIEEAMAADPLGLRLRKLLELIAEYEQDFTAPVEPKKPRAKRQPNCRICLKAFSVHRSGHCPGLDSTDPKNVYTGPVNV